MWWLLGAVCLFLIGWGIVSARSVLFPRLLDIPVPVSLPAFTTTPLTARDGARFDAWVLTPQTAPRGRLLMFHGYYANRHQVLAVAHGLREQGYEVMLIELRGHGSRPGPCTLGVQEADDADVVLAGAAMHEHPRELPLGVLGLSMGGAIACQVAARHPEIRAVVVDSLYGRFFPILADAIQTERHLPPLPFAWITWWSLELALRRRLAALDPIALAPRCRQPLLAIQGGLDRRVSPAVSQAFCDRWAGPNEQWFEPDVAHVGMFPRDPARYLQRVGAFLDRTMR